MDDSTVVFWLVTGGTLGWLGGSSGTLPSLRLPNGMRFGQSSVDGRVVQVGLWFPHGLVGWYRAACPHVGDAGGSSSVWWAYAVQTLRQPDRVGDGRHIRDATPRGSGSHVLIVETLSPEP